MGAPTLIYCASGNPQRANLAVRAGWRYGSRLPGTVYESVYFADQDWKNPNRIAYFDALRTHRPHIASVLDWEEGVRLADVMSWAEEAASICGKVVIIPKIPGTISDIPATVGNALVILGYSVPTSYGASPVPLWEFGRRPVHLLGGSPHKQMELSHYLNVVSCDGNQANLQANKCRFWRKSKSDKGHWIQLKDTGDERAEGANLECMRRSFEEIRAAWETI